MTEPDSTPLESVECPRCEFENPCGSLYCSKCSLALDEDTAQHEIAKDDRLRKVLKILMQDKDLMDKIAEKVKEADD